MDSYENKIVLENVNQFFNKENLFKEKATLVLEANSVTMLYGGSGTGKSAIFDMISYLIAPREGKVIWDSQEITSLEQANKYRSQKIAMIFSNYSFISLLSIEENILLAASLAGRDNLKEKLDTIKNGIFKFESKEFKSLDLSNLISKNNIKNLSNGQKEIIAMSSALLMGTKYLMVDEMLRSFQDDAKIAIWKRLLNYFKENNMGLLYISHWQEAKDVMIEMGVKYASYEIIEQNLIKHEG